MSPYLRPGVFFGVDVWGVPGPKESIYVLNDKVIVRYLTAMSRRSVLLKDTIDALFLKRLYPRCDLLKGTFAMTITVDAAVRAIAAFVGHL